VHCSHVGVDGGARSWIYFDVLGFSHLAGGTVRVVVATLGALAEVLHSLAVSQQTTSWSHGHSLDKVEPSQPLCTFLSATAVQEIGDTTGGLLDEYDTAPLRLIESIGR
jgi:hypothetical protein